jgi:A/G-specific adenine glycosylase
MSCVEPRKLDRALVRILQARLVAWYVESRRPLPWRQTRDPYAVWLSEVMLQQTRVDTVIPYYQRFLREFPTILALAEAPEERVLTLWSGLGYYRRARMLHAAAKQVASEHAGRLPAEAEQLRRLNGVGAYTAGAIASIAFGRRAAVVDGNVARVLTRIYAIEGDVKSSAVRAQLWQIAEGLISEGRCDPGDWNQALMELGATVCLPRAPKCGDCPVRDACMARTQDVVHELPGRVRAKRRPRTVERVSIVLASKGAVLLARRRVDTLFGGLWEPPTTDGKAGPLAARLGRTADDLEWAGEVVHVLSHRRMKVQVHKGTLGRQTRFAVPSSDYDAIEPVAWSRLSERAQAALTRKILEVANVAPRGLRSA